MSMEDILKILVDSRQKPTSQQASDPMTDLIGSLLGGIAQTQGTQSQGFGNLIPQSSQGLSQQTGGGQQPGLSNMMGLLEMFMNGQGQGGSSVDGMNDPIMSLLTPFIAPLAKKANIPPEIAAIVISFVVHKLLAHHPTSGRDSNTFDLDDVLQQMGQGDVSSSLIRSSGMVRELSSRTGLDEATTEKSLQLALGLVGKTIGTMADKKSNPGAASKGKALGKGQKSAGLKRRRK